MGIIWGSWDGSAVHRRWCNGSCGRPVPQHKAQHTAHRKHRVAASEDMSGRGHTADGLHTRAHNHASFVTLYNWRRPQAPTAMLAPEWWLLAMSLIVALGSDIGALGPVILALGSGQAQIIYIQHRGGWWIGPPLHCWARGPGSHPTLDLAAGVNIWHWTVQHTTGVHIRPWTVQHTTKVTIWPWTIQHTTVVNISPCTVQHTTRVNTWQWTAQHTTGVTI